MWFVKPVFPYVPSLSEYLQAIILPTRCFVKSWRKFLTFQGNCTIYKEEAVGEMDIAQLIFYVALCLLPENFTITLCNLMQQKKKKNLCQTFSSRNMFHNLIPTEIRLLHAWLCWTKFSMTWLHLYLLLCWHRRFGSLLSLRQTPTRPVELLKQGVNYSCMVYAASMISINPCFKVFQTTTYSIHLCGF